MQAVVAIATWRWSQRLLQQERFIMVYRLSTGHPVRRADIIDHLDKARIALGVGVC